MSHIAPRPPQRPSNPQTSDKRLDLVGKLEDCIGEVLEATKAYKSPQQQSAHHNANQMFQQRVLASRGQMGNMSDQDWLGTMMQCLNESMRTQQSSFVRNTALDVALKTFASGIFDALGPAYFQEPFDKYMSTYKSSASSNAASGYHTAGKSGIPSPPRETAANQSRMQRPNPHHPAPPTTHAASFPSAHQQLVQRPAHCISPGAVTFPQQEMHGMPMVQRPLPTVRQPGRPPKRQSSVEAPNPPARKRAYTSEALRQAAGPMGPPTATAQSRPGLSNPHMHRLCIDFWDVQQELDVRKRQAILGYGGKWYVFQCHQHEDVLFFKTAEGARHHMMTRHALPNQHIDFLDIVQELGVEVMNCDVARAEKNNLEAVNMWNRVGSTSGPQQDAGIRHEGPVHAPVPVMGQMSPAARSNSASEYSSTAYSEPVPLPSTRIDSPSTILLSDDEVSEGSAADPETVTIKQEMTEKNSKLNFSSTKKNAGSPASTPICPSQSSQPTGGLQGSQEVSTAAAKVVSKTFTSQGVENTQETTGEQTTAPVENVLATSGDSETSTRIAAETPDSAEQIPELTPDSPESSELSEPPSLAELEVFEPKSAKGNDPLVVDGALEAGEIDESCIRVASCSPALSGKAIASPGLKKKQKRRISAAGSAPSTPSEQRNRLPLTPKSSQKRKMKRQSFPSPAQETGPSAHDQFKTKACKKCSERFYFRAQLATHMMSEHPEVIIVE